MKVKKLDRPFVPGASFHVSDDGLEGTVLFDSFDVSRNPIASTHGGGINLKPNDQL